MKKKTVLEHIISRTGIGAAVDLLAGLSNQDFQSTLLELFSRRCAMLDPTTVLKAARTNRFTAPSNLDAASYYEACADALKKAEKAGFTPVLLSPAAPLGTSSVFGAVNQNTVVSASRGTELLSDGTNMLAVLMANHPADEAKNGMHWCAVQRVCRAQFFSGAGMLSHFGLLCMVSRAPDRGSYKTEEELLARHIHFYWDFFSQDTGMQMTVTLRKRAGYADCDGFFARMKNSLSNSFPALILATDEEPTENAYYQGLNFKIRVSFPSGGKNYKAPVEVADGGFVNWMTQLTGSKKERCLISGLGIDRCYMTVPHEYPRSKI